MAAKKKEPKSKPTKAPKLSDIPPPPKKETAEWLAKQAYELRPIDSIQLHPKNPKKGDVEAIGESIEANRFYGAILVQKSTGFILAGNHRWKSAKEKGLKDVPVIVIDCDDATAERILLADNKTADRGSYDQAALFALAEARAKDGGLKGTGFHDVDLERMRAKFSTPEKFPEYNEQVKVTYLCPSCGFQWS